MLSAVIMKGSHDTITTWYLRIISEAKIWLIVPINHINVITYPVWHTINDTACLRFNGLNSYEWTVTLQYLMETQTMNGVLSSTNFSRFQSDWCLEKDMKYIFMFYLSGYCNVLGTCNWNLSHHYTRRHHHHCRLHHRLYIVFVNAIISMTMLL